MPKGLAWRSPGAPGYGRSGASDCRSSGNPVVFEPGQHLRPALLGLLRPIARPIVGVEPVRRIRIDDELAGLVRRFARRLPLFDRVLRDALVGTAVERERRAFDAAGDVDRILRRQLGDLAIGAIP